MPITCESTPVVSKTQVQCTSARNFVPRDVPKKGVKLHNSILCLCDESYKEVMTELVTASIDSIENNFNCSDLIEENIQLRSIVASAGHTTLCVVFFMLLNVDGVLKDKIIDMDSDCNLKKMNRFLIDLRTILAVNFFTDEGYSQTRFVENCVDCYICS